MAHGDGLRDRMEAISATARIHHTSCRRCPYWTVEGYRSDTQGLPPRYADRGSADESRERGCRGAHRRADAARLHARSKPDIRSPWCGGQIEPNAATNGGTEESQCRGPGDSQLSGSGHRQIIGHCHGHCDRLGRSHRIRPRRKPRAAGGNVTGLSDVATTLSTKRLSLLKELLPQLRRVAMLWNKG